MNRAVKAGGAAIIAAFLCIISCIIPFTNAISQNIIASFDTWALGYYGSDGRYYANDQFQGYYFRTSPGYSVVTNAEYNVTFSGVTGGYRCYINEFDNNNNFIQRVSKDTQVFTYIPGENVGRISLTLRSYNVTGVSCTMYYDSQAPVNPNGIEQIDDEVHYGSNGDFTYYSDNLQKHLMFYKYMPTGDIKYIRIEAVNNYGQRLKFRVIGYVHGNEVFRSGLAEYGSNIDIQNANFDYYDIYLVNEDLDGEIIDAQSISTFRYIYGRRYYVPFPTDPVGVIEDIEGTDYIDLSQFDNVQFPTTPDITDYSKGLSLISSNINSLLSVFPFYTMFAGIAVIIWLLWVASRNGGD